MFDPLEDSRKRVLVPHLLWQWIHFQEFLLTEAFAGETKECELLENGCELTWAAMPQTHHQTIGQPWVTDGGLQNL